MKILIVGNKGALGSELTYLYKKQKPVALDKDELDITNEAEVISKLSEIKPEVVFNCAAYNEVDKAEDDRQIAENINGYAVGYLAKACSVNNALLVHFSTNYVFDGNKSEGYNEDDPPNPLSAYGKSKVLGEIELQKNTDKFYLVRTAWLYGGKSTIGKKSFVEKMLELANKDQSIDAIEDEFGNPTFALDLAQAVAALVSQKKEFGIYHITNAGSCSWYDWAKEIFSIKNIDAKLAMVKAEQFADKRKAARPKYGILNNTKFIELRPWTEALKEYLSR